MRDWRGPILVLVILGIGATVGAVAGYRLHVQDDWQRHGEPVAVRTEIEWPNGTAFAANVTLAPGNSTALGALQAAAAVGNFTVVTSFFDDFGGYFVYSIGDHAAERGSRCGWMYGVNNHDFVARAADRTWLEPRDVVIWYWGCS